MSWSAEIHLQPTGGGGAPVPEAAHRLLARPPPPRPRLICPRCCPQPRSDRGSGVFHLAGAGCGGNAQRASRHKGSRGSAAGGDLLASADALNGNLELLVFSSNKVKNI